MDEKADSNFRVGVRRAQDETPNVKGYLRLLQVCTVIVVSVAAFVAITIV